MRKTYRKTYLEKFEEWCLEKGNFKRSNLPTEGLSKTTAKNKLKKIRRILVERGYVEMVDLGQRKYDYHTYSPIEHPELKHIKDISIKEFSKWISKEFPGRLDTKAKQRKLDYVMAIWKFGEFLVFGLKIWKPSRLHSLKQRVRAAGVKQKKVKLLPLERIDDFIEYLKTINRTHHIMVFLSRWLGGMRYEEVINVKKDLRGKTLDIDLDKDTPFTCIVWGKGEGGLNKERHPTVTSKVKEELEEYLNWCHDQGNTSEWLVSTQYGKKYSENVGCFNNTLKDHAKNFGMSEREIALVSTHKIGRHAFATYYYSKVGLFEAMEEMGIEDEKTFKKYPDLNELERTSKMEKITNGGVQTNHTGELSGTAQALLKIIEGLSTGERQALKELIG